MPNECWCEVRIGANAETIKMLSEVEFAFEKLRPRPLDQDWYEWNCAHWGTKWERSEYKVKGLGEEGMEMKFKTAWNPPFELFRYLATTYHDIWIRCDWSEEGGYAGVFVTHWDEKLQTLHVTDAHWMDWCLEEWHYRMVNNDTKSYWQRPRSHCKSDRQFKSKKSFTAIVTTRKEQKELNERIKKEFQEQLNRDPTDREYRMNLIRIKANQMWPEYAAANTKLLEQEPLKIRPPSPTPIELDEALLDQT